jgi:hypothetical protein
MMDSIVAWHPSRADASRSSALRPLETILRPPNAPRFLQLAEGAEVEKNRKHNRTAQFNVTRFLCTANRLSRRLRK